MFQNLLMKLNYAPPPSPLPLPLERQYCNLDIMTKGVTISKIIKLIANQTRGPWATSLTSSNQ